MALHAFDGSVSNRIALKQVTAIKPLKCPQSSTCLTVHHDIRRDVPDKRPDACGALYYPAPALSMSVIVVFFKEATVCDTYMWIGCALVRTEFVLITIERTCRQLFYEQPKAC